MRVTGNSRFEFEIANPAQVAMASAAIAIAAITAIRDLLRAAGGIFRGFLRAEIADPFELEFQIVRGLKAVVRFLREACGNQAIEGCGNCGLQRTYRRRIIREDCADDRRGRFPFEGALARSGFVEHRAETENV